MTSKAQKLLSLKFAVLTALSPLFIASSPASAAFRNTCQDVDIEIKNETGKMVKVYDLEYYNDRTGRYKNMFFKDRTIANNGTYTEKDRNLLKVRAVRTRIKVQYREMENGRVIKGLKSRFSADVDCSHGHKFTVTLRPPRRISPGPGGFPFPGWPRS